MVNSTDDLAMDKLDTCLYALWSSGFTRRWHMNAAMSCFEDYICAHQGRCGQLVISIFPDHSIELLRAMVTHDAAEFKVGDLSAPFKKVGGNLVAWHANLEARILARMGFGFELTDLDERRLKMVDRLDAYLFVSLRRPSEFKRQGWIKARRWLVNEAYGLGCGEVIEELLCDADTGFLS